MWWFKDRVVETRKPAELVILAGFSYLFFKNTQIS